MLWEAISRLERIWWPRLPKVSPAKTRTRARSGQFRSLKVWLFQRQCVQQGQGSALLMSLSVQKVTASPDWLPAVQTIGLPLHSMPIQSLEHIYICLLSLAEFHVYYKYSLATTTIQLPLGLCFPPLHFEFKSAYHSLIVYHPRTSFIVFANCLSSSTIIYPLF
jgi:hypothetical protein